MAIVTAIDGQMGQCFVRGCVEATIGVAAAVGVVVTVMGSAGMSEFAFHMVCLTGPTIARRNHLMIDSIISWAHIRLHGRGGRAQ